MRGRGLPGVPRAKFDATQGAEASEHRKGTHFDGLPSERTFTGKSRSTLEKRWPLRGTRNNINLRTSALRKAAKFGGRQ